MNDESSKHMPATRHADLVRRVLPEWRTIFDPPIKTTATTLQEAAGDGWNACLNQMRANLATLASQPAEQPRGEVLDTPAKVGAVVFKKGAPWSSVVACAQRAYAYKDELKLTPEQTAAFRQAVQPKPEQAVGEPVFYISNTDISWLSKFPESNAAITAFRSPGDSRTAVYTAQPKPEQDHSRDATKMIGQAVGDGVTVWMIRSNTGVVHWDESGCVFPDEESAQREATLMTDSDPDGQSFGAFALSSTPCPAPVEVGDGVVERGPAKGLNAEGWARAMGIMGTTSDDHPTGPYERVLAAAIRGYFGSADPYSPGSAPAATFDRTIETPRRRQAVEKLLELGWTYHHERGWIGRGIEEPQRPAVATPAEVTDEMIEIAAKGMWDCVPRGVEWERAHEPIAADWRRLARAALTALASKCQVRKDGDGEVSEGLSCVIDWHTRESASQGKLGNTSQAEMHHCYAGILRDVASPSARAVVP